MSYYVYAMAEDPVTVAITERLFRDDAKFILHGGVQNKNGVSNLNKQIPKWNEAANVLTGEAGGNVVFFMLRDFDSLAYPQNRNNCPETETAALLENQTKSRNLLLRFAVAEGENWLLADYDGLRRFLSLRSRGVISPDEIEKGKEEIIALAQKSQKREYRAGMPPQSPDRKIGPRYNDILTEFIRDHWNIEEAAKHSKSLHRTLKRLAEFPN